MTEITHFAIDANDNHSENLHFLENSTKAPQFIHIMKGTIMCSTKYHEKAKIEVTDFRTKIITLGHQKFDPEHARFGCLRNPKVLSMRYDACTTYFGVLML